MTVNNKNVVKWFDDMKGKLTYSMYGSRNGADGTADCSGAMTQAIMSSGGSYTSTLYSTVNLSGYLKQNGYERISVNEDWNAKIGDIVLMSFEKNAKNMNGSGGSGGHVVVMKDSIHSISVDYTTGGQKGTAVSEHVWDNYYYRNLPPYIEVWRLNVSRETISVGDTVKLENHATHFQTGQKIADFAKNKNYKVLQIKNVNQSNSKKAYLLQNINSWLLEQDVTKQ